MILFAIGIVLAIPTALLLGYLMMLSLLARFSPRIAEVKAERMYRIAVIVPAHNEEGAIAETIRSIQNVEYPPQSFEAVVIADNCTDATASIARAMGARVFERESKELRGKGYALRWCFDRILRDHPDFDAVVVVDADSILSPDFLSVVNHYLNCGALAIQSSDLVKAREGAWSSESTRMGFTLYNVVRPLGRRVLGCSAGLRGNGMCFAVEALRRVPWDAYSKAEDLEYGLKLLLNGIGVMFAPEAKVYATMPADARNAESQRARWEGGRFPVVKQFAGSMLVAAFRRRSFAVLDALIDLVTPPLVNLMGFALLMGIFSALFWLAGVPGMGYVTLVWFLSVAAGGLHVIVGLNAAGADRKLFAALLHIPRYVLWKVVLYAKLLRGGTSNEWVRTTREVPQPDPKSQP